MGNNDDFDFDDDFSFDDNDFDLGDDLPPELGDDEDLPDLEDDEESSGPNRTFVVIAGIMIFLFVVGLGAVLFLATRPTPTDPRSLTAQAVVLLNQTVQAQLFQTQTESANIQHITETANAFTATPSMTPTPTFPPTITPTPTLDSTSLAGTAIAAQLFAAQTAAALQAQQPQGPVGLEQAFATQVAFATSQGVVAQAAFGTQAAVATQGVLLGSSGTQIALNITSTQAALDLQVPQANNANNSVQSGFATRAASGGAFATRVIEATPPALQTQGALATPALQATQAAVSTQIAFSTLNAISNQVATDVAFATQAIITSPESPATQSALATQVILLPTQVQLANFAGQAAFATQQAFLTPAYLSTVAAVATQTDLALRADLVRQAMAPEVVVVPTSVPTAEVTAGQGGGVSADAVALTATALANLLAPTQELFTAIPGATVTAFAPIPTALPQTGIFEDVVGGGRDGLGMIAMAAVGLLGVIVVSRRLRSTNNKKD